jgi:hypothetical protein
MYIGSAEKLKFNLIAKLVQDWINGHWENKSVSNDDIPLCHY